MIPINDSNCSEKEGLVDLHEFIHFLSRCLTEREVTVSRNSGGAFTVTIQALTINRCQMLISDLGLGSTESGLVSATKTYVSSSARAILIERGGGSGQILQALGAGSYLNTNAKYSYSSDEGFASIRVIHRRYFKDACLRRDIDAGIGFTNWLPLTVTLGILYSENDGWVLLDVVIAAVLESKGREFVSVVTDPK